MTAATKSAKVSIKPIEVPKALQEGEKFIKWDEVCNIFTLSDILKNILTK